MRVLPTIFLTLFLLTTGVIAQERDGNLSNEDLQKNNAEVVKLFQQKEYKTALPLAGKSVELAKKLFGLKHLEVAASLRSLGYLQYLTGDQKKARETLKDAFSVYEKLPDLSQENGVVVAKMLELIAAIRYETKMKDGEEPYRLALEWREKYNGKESPETLVSLTALGTIDYWSGNYADAAKFLRRVLEINASNPDLSKSDSQVIYYRCQCAYRKIGKIDEFEPLAEKYSFDSKPLGDKANDPKSAPLLPAITKEMAKQKTINGGVINGKAVNLPSPGYPAAARMAGIRGIVNVQVLIDEEGRVVYACTVNDANKYLAEASENAAYRASFRQTELEGKPVRVFGVITYAF